MMILSADGSRKQQCTKAGANLLIFLIEEQQAQYVTACPFLHPVISQEKCAGSAWH